MGNSDTEKAPLESAPLPSNEVLQRLAISESGFVFDPASGHNFTVNETGLRLLRLLQQNQSVEQILQTLRNEFDADPREIERDVIEFISSLRDNVEN